MLLRYANAMLARTRTAKLLSASGHPARCSHPSSALWTTDAPVRKFHGRLVLRFVLVKDDGVQIAIAGVSDNTAVRESLLRQVGLCLQRHRSLGRQREEAHFELADEDGKLRDGNADVGRVELACPLSIQRIPYSENSKRRTFGRHGEGTVERNFASPP